MAENDLERIHRGAIPMRAEFRLKRLARSSTPFFTSDLSAKAYVAALTSQMQPLAQVMGSCAVARVRAPEQAGSWWGSSEIQALSAPWNVARSRAFARLEQEAQFAGADAVVGVKMSVDGESGDSETLDYVVFGTAVRDGLFPRPRGGRPAVCTLSAQEVYLLRQTGAQICGVVSYTTVNSIKLERESNQLFGPTRGSISSQNAELPELADGIAQTRRRALAAVRKQAAAVSANHLVISVLKHEVQHHHYGITRNDHHFFYVTFHIVGTAIKSNAGRPQLSSEMSAPSIVMDLSRDHAPSHDARTKPGSRGSSAR